MKQYKRALKSDFEGVSNKYISTIFFTLAAGKMAKAFAHQRNILEIQKLVKVPI
jgi:hypothetical protein